MLTVFSLDLFVLWRIGVHCFTNMGMLLVFASILRNVHSFLHFCKFLTVIYFRLFVIFSIFAKVSRKRHSGTSVIMNVFYCSLSGCQREWLAGMRPQGESVALCQFQPWLVTALPCTAFRACFGDNLLTFNLFSLARRAINKLAAHALVSIYSIPPNSSTKIW